MNYYTLQKPLDHTLYLIFVILISFVFASGCNRSEHYHKIEGYAQGGGYHIIYSDLDSNGKMIEAPVDEIGNIVAEHLRMIDYSVSGYNKSSIISKVNNNEECQLDSIFIDLFNRSYQIYNDTKGEFDVSGAPLFDFWGFGFKNPDKLEDIIKNTETKGYIDSLLTIVGMDKVRLVTRVTESGDSAVFIEKDDPRIKLNFNAIAQGYTCDFVASALKQKGIVNYMVEVGSEILCKGLNSRGKEWNIGIDAPVDGNMTAGENIQDILSITDCGIVTSGNYRKFYIIEGNKYPHTINPITGYPVSHNLLSATIIAADAATADAYATYCMVIGMDESIKFLESRDDLSGYLISSDRVWNENIPSNK